ncbi:MAG: hypothetical protein ACKO6M_06790 [Bacteroidota bacterium]
MNRRRSIPSESMNFLGIFDESIPHSTMTLRSIISVFSLLFCFGCLSACSDPDTVSYPRPSYADSATAAAAANGNAQGNPLMNPSAQPVASNGPAPKINPPHGEPGHRCDVAVGAPLDGSAPAPKVVSTPTVTQSPVQLTPQATQISTSDKATETPVEAPEASPNKTAPAVDEQTAKPDGQKD